ncbi:AEC family transporter [Micromonospora craniellae]|uniref:AEC family transporter n=1 Tax=Micromonospora craniellae TaxID=2294034 RepID=A0A372FSN9_9ACTN|nr:AEC family transporter [Micromonospora craniellae]QOC91590.1 AEC family transporter [Micromonospora craniellae]RFS43529.1 AEC family transporter [Micromonospora craniellae]
MRGVLTGFAVIATVIAIGYLVGRIGLLGPEGPAVLSRVSFFVATPALLFETVSRTDVSAVFSSALLVTLIGTTVVAALFAAVAMLWWRRPAPEATIGALAASYVNAGNIGIPIAVYVLGDAAFVAPVLMFQVAVMAPLAFAVLESAAARERRSVVRAAVRPLVNPITVACGLGVAVSVAGWSPPEPLMRPVELVAAMAVPAALLAYGLSLRGAPPPGSGDTAWDVRLAVVLKTLVHPAVAYLVARYGLGLSAPLVLACTVTAALPTAQNVFVYAVRYGRGVVLARDAILLSTVTAVPVLIAVALLAG